MFHRVESKGINSSLLIQFILSQKSLLTCILSAKLKGLSQVYQQQAFESIIISNNEIVLRRHPRCRHGYRRQRCRTPRHSLYRGVPHSEARLPSRPGCWWLRRLLGMLPAMPPSQANMSRRPGCWRIRGMLGMLSTRARGETLFGCLPPRATSVPSG
ncbi:hypothetical protein B0H34DRAFT_379871 [Crassisporium funariophilum]|nr:hypothetical protein B0H34DRAFT_379871 [Crassisporium funariophilum]